METTDPRKNIAELTNLLREVNDRLEAELDDWQPIETAPLGEVLVWGKPRLDLHC